MILFNSCFSVHYNRYHAINAIFFIDTHAIN